MTCTCGHPYEAHVGIWHDWRPCINQPCDCKAFVLVKK